MRSSDTAATAADIIEFRCNICGEQNACSAALIGRETESCEHCHSSVRSRALMRILARELFGADIALPDFPVVKAVRGIGLSDMTFPERLAIKLDYTNTFFHKEPQFDIGNPGSEHDGTYDFLISSEVFEHVAPPVERVFENAHRVLKDSGLLLMTVPYTLRPATTEHFPDLHEYGLTRLGPDTILVNRKRTGEMQIFQDLCFHGGDGTTIEMRQFSERDLLSLIKAAGFSTVHIYAEDYEPFGILLREKWSLPMVARKQPFTLSPVAIREVMDQWTDRVQKERNLKNDLKALRADYKQYEAWAKDTVALHERQAAERTAWTRGIEAQLKERTDWAEAQDLELETRTQQVAAFSAALEARAQTCDALENQLLERGEWALRLEAELAALRIAHDAVNQSWWTRIGRKLGMVR